MHCSSPVRTRTTYLSRMYPARSLNAEPRAYSHDPNSFLGLDLKSGNVTVGLDGNGHNSFTTQLDIGLSGGLVGTLDELSVSEYPDWNPKSIGDVLYS